MDSAPTPDVTGWNTGSSDQVSAGGSRSLSDPRSWMLLGALALFSGMFVLGGLYRILTDRSSWLAIALLAAGVLGMAWLIVAALRSRPKQSF